jgi:hypothetical protein
MFFYGIPWLSMSATAAGFTIERDVTVPSVFTTAKPVVEEDAGATCTFYDLSDPKKETEIADLTAYAGKKVKIRCTSKVEDRTKIRLEITLNAQDLQDRAPTAATIGGAGRGATDVPPIVEDTLQLLAEIAYERAKSQAYAVLYSSAEELICERAELPPDVTLTIELDGRPWTIEPPDGKLLPQTCDALKATGSFAALVNAAPQLVEALQADLLSFASRTVLGMVVGGHGLNAWGKAAAQAMGRELTGVFWTHVLSGEPMDLSDVELLLARFKRINFQDLPPEPSTPEEKALAYGLELASTIAAECALTTPPEDATSASSDAPSACSADGVLARLEGTITYVGLDLDSAAETPEDPAETPKAAEAALETLRPMLAALATDLIQFHRARGTPEAKTRLGISIVFDVLDLVVALPLEPQDKTPAVWNPAVRDPATLLVDLRSMTLALVEHDTLGATADALGLLQRILQEAQHAREATFIDELAAEMDTLDEQNSTRKKFKDLQTQLKEIDNPAKRYRRARNFVDGLDKKILTNQRKRWENADIALVAMESLDRIQPLVTVLASNAQSLGAAQDDPSQAEALREARKEALTALVDATTQRAGREGDYVVSLGSMVGLVPMRLGFRGDPDDTGPAKARLLFELPGGRMDSTTDPAWSPAGQDVVTVPLALPMGVAFQCLPGRRAGFPGYIQVSPIDLALFLPDQADDPTADLDWSDFLMAGVQGGVLVGKPQNLFALGLDLRYAPYDESAPLQAMFQLSYVVPFLDIGGRARPWKHKAGTPDSGPSGESTTE